MNEPNARIPVNVFVQGSKFNTSRAFDSNINLFELIKEVFPNYEKALDNDLNRVKVFSNGVELKGNKPIGFYYDYFKNPNGFLYFVFKL